MTPETPTSGGLPPEFAERVMRWSLSSDDRSAILGDLQEECAAIAVTDGSSVARRWYRWQVLRSIAPNLGRRVRGHVRRTWSGSPRTALWLLPAAMVLMGAPSALSLWMLTGDGAFVVALLAGVAFFAMCGVVTFVGGLILPSKVRRWLQAPPLSPGRSLIFFGVPFAAQTVSAFLSRAAGGLVLALSFGLMVVILFWRSRAKSPAAHGQAKNEAVRTD